MRACLLLVILCSLPAGRAQKFSALTKIALNQRSVLDVGVAGGGMSITLRLGWASRRIRQAWTCSAVLIMGGYSRGWVADFMAGCVWYKSYVNQWVHWPGRWAETEHVPTSAGRLNTHRSACGPGAQSSPSPSFFSLHPGSPLPLWSLLPRRARLYPPNGPLLAVFVPPIAIQVNQWKLTTKSETVRETGSGIQRHRGRSTSFKERSCRSSAPLFPPRQSPHPAPHFPINTIPPTSPHNPLSSAR
ncbi:unnamed protein product [Arctogadus glacialis]